MRTKKNETANIAQGDQGEMQPVEPSKLGEEPQRAGVKDNEERQNPFNEPIHDEYPDGGVAAAPAPVVPETTVEHPLSPTDANPNPHGTREQPFVATVTKDEGRTAPQEGSAKITSTFDGPDLHLGDGRTLRKGESAKVTPEVAKDLIDQGKAKRG